MTSQARLEPTTVHSNLDIVNGWTVKNLDIVKMWRWQNFHFKAKYRLNSKKSTNSKTNSADQVFYYIQVALYIHTYTTSWIAEIHSICSLNYIWNPCIKWWNLILVCLQWLGMEELLFYRMYTIYSWMPNTVTLFFLFFLQTTFFHLNQWIRH